MQNKYKLLIVAAGILGLLVLWLVPETTTVEQSTARSVSREQLQRATTSGATVPVSGVVQAADTAVVAAATNGVIERVAVDVGSVVDVQTLLVRQATPVADATVRHRDAQAGLTAAEQQAAVDARAYAAKQAAAVAYSAETIAALRQAADDARVTEQTTALRTSVESGVTTLLNALTFAQDNRDLFADERREQFTAIVSDLYGRLPNQFHTGVLYGTSAGSDVLEQVAELRSIDTARLSTLEIQTLAAVVSGQLRAVVDLYTTAEQTVLDPDEVVIGGDVYDGYFSARSSAISSLSSLESATAALQATVDTRTQQSASQAQSVVVSELDKAAAARQATFAQSVASAAEAVAAAARAVATAEQSLGDVTAPFAGTVAEVLVEPGEYATAGTPLLRLVGDGAREVAVTVPAAVIEHVTPGQALLVAGQEVGHVVRWSPESNGNSYDVVISLSDSSYRTGASLAGELVLVAHDELRVLPREYVYTRGTETYVVTEDGTQHPIQILSDNGATLVVRLGGAVTLATLVPERSVNVQ